MRDIILKAHDLLAQVEHKDHELKVKESVLNQKEEELNTRETDLNTKHADIQSRESFVLTSEEAVAKNEESKSRFEKSNMLLRDVKAEKEDFESYRSQELSEISRLKSVYQTLLEKNVQREKELNTAFEDLNKQKLNIKQAVISEMAKKL